MLPRNSRVRTPAEFSETLRSGARAGRRNVVVSAHLDSSGLKAGFIVSKAVGNAVVRNRVKRRLRAAVADQLTGPLLPDVPVDDIVDALVDGLLPG